VTRGGSRGGGEEGERAKEKQSAFYSGSKIVDDSASMRIPFVSASWREKEDDGSP